MKKVIAILAGIITMTLFCCERDPVSICWECEHVISFADNKVAYSVVLCEMSEEQMLMYVKAHASDAKKRREVSCKEHIENSY